MLLRFCHPRRSQVAPKKVEQLSFLCCSVRYYLQFAIASIIWRQVIVFQEWPAYNFHRPGSLTGCRHPTNTPKHDLKQTRCGYGTCAVPNADGFRQVMSLSSIPIQLNLESRSPPSSSSFTSTLRPKACALVMPVLPIGMYAISW